MSHIRGAFEQNLPLCCALCYASECVRSILGLHTHGTKAVHTCKDFRPQGAQGVADPALHKQVRSEKYNTFRQVNYQAATPNDNSSETQGTNRKFKIPNSGSSKEQCRSLASQFLRGSSSFYDASAGPPGGQMLQGTLLMLYILL